MTEYRKAQKKIVYDVLSQIKDLFPKCDKDFYYTSQQAKLYKLFKKFGLVRVMRKYGVLDK